MHTSRWLWLYRPTLPSARAQAIQILHAAWAMAGTGATATVLAEAPRRVSGQQVLHWAGLAPQPGLHLQLLRGGRTLASLRYRAAVMAWARRGPGVVLVRRKRHLLALRRWLPAHIKVVVEAHEVAHYVALDAGRPDASAARIEAEALAMADGVVCNAPGTARLLRDLYPSLPPVLVAENATRADRSITSPTEGGAALYLGSAHAWKGLLVAARGAAQAGVPLRVVGPLGEGSERLRGLSGVSLWPPVSPREVPTLLESAGSLVLPASDSWFGRELTSPLKGWDYRAAGRPIVGADTPAIRAVAGEALVPYALDDVQGAAAAFQTAHHSSAARKTAWDARRLRTWDQRAAEVRAFVEGL